MHRYQPKRLQPTENHPARIAALSGVLLAVIGFCAVVKTYVKKHHGTAILGLALAAATFITATVAIQTGAPARASNDITADVTVDAITMPAPSAPVKVRIPDMHRPLATALTPIPTPEPTPAPTPAPPEYLFVITDPDPDYLCQPYAIPPDQRSELEQLVMGEAGDQGFEGAACVAQCIRDAFVYDCYTNITDLRHALKYAGLLTEPNQDVKDAVAYIFDEGNGAVQHRMLYFYSGWPEKIQKWHESQHFILEYKEHRFFDRWT